MTTVGTSPPTNNPATLQAENGVIAGGSKIQRNKAGYNGSGFVNFNRKGGSVTFRNVDGGTGGTATVKIRYALKSGSRTGTFVVNGISKNITFSSTGSWSKWSTLSKTVSLKSGTGNTIVINSTGQDLSNIDQITVTTGG